MDEDPKPEPVATVTVLDKANQFRTKAELIGAQQSDTDELTRLTHRVAAVKAALQKLDRAMTAARIVSDLTDAPTINMAVDDGYHDFRRKVEGSNFNDTVFRAATRKLAAASTQFDTEAQQVWKTWAAQRGSGTKRPASGRWSGASENAGHDSTASPRHRRTRAR